MSLFQIVKNYKNLCFGVWFQRLSKAFLSNMVMWKKYDIKMLPKLVGFSLNCGHYLYSLFLCFRFPLNYGHYHFLMGRVLSNIENSSKKVLCLINFVVFNSFKEIFIMKRSFRKNPGILNLKLAHDMIQLFCKFG